MRMGHFEICILKLILKNSYLGNKWTNFQNLTYAAGRRVIEISGSLIWSITQMELICNPYGEFQ